MNSRVIRSKINFKLECSMNFMLEMYRFLVKRKKLWLTPIILIMLVFGVLVISVNGSVMAPFIYTLF